MFKLLLVFMCFFLVTGCTIDLSTDDKDVKDPVVEKDEDDEIKEKEEVVSKGVESTLSNPLSVGDYGLASKYNAVTDGYKDVDVVVTKIYDNSEEIVNSYNLNNPDNTISKTDGYKYVVLDYEVVFFDFETESFGTSTELDVEVVNTDGNSFVVNDIKQVIQINTLSKSMGVVNGDKGTVQIVFSIPESVNNYLIKFGTLEHTIAYYKV